MSERLIIDKTNSYELDRVGIQLARVYQNAFAGPPWNERSRCRDGFSAESPGGVCSDCDEVRQPAYNADELVEGWSQVIEREEGQMQLTLLDGSPICATIARPTSVDELYMRKYADVPTMQAWLAQNLPSEQVWIEDTFADREIRPSGNMKNRAAVLGSIAMKYDGLYIVTRTLAVPVIASTVRDVGASTDMYIGTENIGKAWEDAVQSASVAPDRRTVLAVDGGRLL